MASDLETRLARAREASGDELKALVHDPNEEVLLALFDNPSFEEEHVKLLLDRLDLPGSVLSAIAGKGKWAASEAVRLGLARHPRTPKHIALAALRNLYLFDLVRLSLLPSAPADIRRVAEESIVTRVPHLPVGEKLTLARRGPARVVGALLAEGHAQAVKLALQNAFLTESQVLRVLANRKVPARVVAAVAQHPKWSCQYNIRVALVRNLHTPASAVAAFIRDLTIRDLTDLSKLEDLPPHVRKCLEQERSRRGRGSGKRG